MAAQYPRQTTTETHISFLESVQEKGAEAQGEAKGGPKQGVISGSVKACVRLGQIAVSSTMEHRKG